LGHLTRKNPSPYDLYCVGGMLSLTQSTFDLGSLCWHICVAVLQCHLWLLNILLILNFTLALNVFFNHFSVML